MCKSLKIRGQKINGSYEADKENYFDASVIETVVLKGLKTETIAAVSIFGLKLA